MQMKNVVAFGEREKALVGLHVQGSREICLVTHVLIFCKIKLKYLKSLGPIDCKFHGHYKNDGFFFNEYKIKQFSSVCKYANISVMKKKRSKKITCQQ